MGICQAEKFDIKYLIGKEQTYKKIQAEKLKSIKIKQFNYNSDNKSSLDSTSIKNVLFNNTKRSSSNNNKYKKIIPKEALNQLKKKSKHTIQTYNKTRSLNEQFSKENCLSNRTIQSTINKIPNPKDLFTEEKMPVDNRRTRMRINLRKENKLYRSIMSNSANKSLDSRFYNLSNIKSPSIMSNKPKNININKKIINDEDDTDTIIYNLDEEINKKIIKKNNYLILSFDGEKKEEDIQLYYLNEFNFNPQNKFSNEKDFDDILQSQVYKNKITFTNLLLILPERRWYKEIIDLSDLIKTNREKKNCEPLLFYEYLNKFIKIYNHFNHLVYALAFFYSHSLLYNKSNSFKKEKLNLPNHNSLEWIKGFEWKGLHIRVLTYEQAKKLIHEIKALKYILFDYLQLFNNHNSNNNDNLLSNEIIFPFMSYAYVGGLYLYVSVEIKKIFYDENFLISNVNADENKMDKMRKSLIRQSLRLSIKYDNFEYNNNGDIDNISFDEKILNEDINLANYSKKDLNKTKILHKISENNLLKIFDDYNENTKEKKFKFILINIYSLLPNLFKEDDKTIYHNFNVLNCIDIKNEFEAPRYINLTKVNNLNKTNEMDIISKLIRINATKENIGIYQNKIENIDYKIIYDNGKKGNKINEQVTKFFVQFPLIQNPELSRLLVTEYLNVGNLNIILNKYNTENTQEIPDRNIIIYRTTFKVKMKYSLVDYTKEQIFPKSTEEYITYFKQVCKEMSDNSYKIRNIDNLYDFCERFGLNKKFLPFCIELIEDSYLSNLIQIYLYASFIKKFYNYHEGHTFLMKLAIFERTKDESIINSSDFIKDNNIIEMQKQFIVDIIKLIFLPVEILKESDTKEPFSKKFFQNISFFVFLKMLKIKNFEKYINFKSTLSQLEINQILIRFNEISRNNPFLFIDSLEKMINFRMNPFIKYRASIDINNLKNLTKENITIFSPKVKSFVDICSIASYIFTDFASNSPTPPKNMENKMNPLLSKIELDNFYPYLMFKSPIDYDNKNNNNIFKPVHYYIYNEDIMKKYLYILEQILDGIISHNGEKELFLFKSYLYSMLTSLFVHNNLNEAKDLLIKMKEILKYQYFFSFTQYSVLYLLEAFTSIDNLFSSEQFYYKTLLLSFLNQGDIRSKKCKIHQFLMFPLFQLSKITASYNNIYLNEYLNELNILLDKKIYDNFVKNNKLSLGYYSFPYNCSSMSPKDNKQNKNYLNDNNFKFFMCNVIIDYLYSIDTLTFDDEYLLFNKINIKEELEKETEILSNINKTIKVSESYSNFKKCISDYLLDELSYQKYAPGNILISFGNNNYYQTAQNYSEYIITPRIIYSLLNKKIKKIFSGYDYNFIIDENDKIYSWGLNIYGQCGIPDKDILHSPTEITISELDQDEKIINIYCGNNFTYFLSNKSSLYMCGYNLLTKEKISPPKKIHYFFEKEKISHIEIGENFCLFLTKWGNVYSLGEGRNGQLVREHDKDKIYEIKQVENIRNIESISCGNNHCFAIGKNNVVFCWGANNRGQLGLDENNESIILPKKLVLNNEIDNIFCGKDFTVFLTGHKEILVCGNNDEGQLGIENDIYSIFENDKDCLNPTKVEQFYNLEIIKVVCGENSCIAMVRDSTTKEVNIWSWGNNKEGQLGLGSDIEKSKPKPIPSLLEYINHYPKDIACGKNHCLVLLERNDEINTDDNKIINDMITKYNKF